MKVLHLPIIICNIASEMVRTLNKVGVKADYMVLDNQKSDWLLTHNNIKFNLQASTLVKNDPGMLKLKRALSDFLLKAIYEYKYDIFHFHYNHSLFSLQLGNFEDLAILKKAGKKIVVSYWGCEIRTKSINSKYPYNTCQNCVINCDEIFGIDKINLFAKYADLKLIHMAEQIEYAPPGTKLVPTPIDTTYWKNSGQIRKDPKDPLKILHSFGNSNARGDIKGTTEILGAISQLKKEGYGLDYLFCDQVPNSQLKPVYEKVDLLIEQLKYGTYGLTALEAMSMGLPVMGHIRSPYRAYFNNEVPIIEANPTNITDVLRGVVKNKDRLVELGQKSREFVIKYHEARKNASKLASLYRDLMKKKPTTVSPISEIKKGIRRGLNIKSLFLVNNGALDDQIVQKEAESLAAEGFQTHALDFAPESIFKGHPLPKKISSFKIHRISYRPSNLIGFGKGRVLIILLNLSKLIFFRQRKMFSRSRLGLLDYYLTMTLHLIKEGFNLHPDFVHAVGFETLLAGYMIKKFTGAKLIYDSRETGTRKDLAKFLEKFLLKKVDGQIKSDSSKKLLDLYDKIYTQDHDLHFLRNR